MKECYKLPTPKDADQDYAIFGPHLEDSFLAMVDSNIAQCIDCVSSVVKDYLEVNLVVKVVNDDSFEEIILMLSEEHFSK
ncbi:hypothetical protein KI387_025825, partial [Taxus chinensis]